MSSVSLSSSFSPSAASSMPLPASTPSTHSHSHSDTTTSDHQLPSPSHTSNESVSSTFSSSHNLRSSLSASSMGQVVSRPPVNTAFPSSSTQPCLGSSSSVAGSRFKRAFGRRKKSDVILPSSITSPTGANVKASSASNDSLYGTVNSAPARQLGAKQLTLQLASHVFSRKQSGSAPASPAMLPPPLPPKHGAPHPTPQHSPSSDNVDNRMSVLTTSNSSIAPALDYIRRTDTSTGPEDAKKDTEKVELKDIRRKSDSTLSHHTIRPVLGGKTPRPVSLAESFQSNHTIVPVNKRLSALLTDAEYATPEEEPERIEGFQDSLGRSTSPDSQGSPAASLKARDRRSHSLNLGSPFSLMSSLPTAAQASVSLDVIPPSVSRSVPEESIKTTGSSPFILKPVIPLYAEASHTSQSSSPAAERTLPEIPQTQQRPPFVPSANTGFPAFRQTAISMTSGLAPAAGLARRAVEKMGRVWGSRSPPPNSPLAPPISLSPSFPIGIVYRTSSGHSEPASRRKNRHTPQTPSISSTGSSMSDHEGPQLGRCLRGPINTLSTGAGMGGLVFGRDLKACVNDTALDTIRNSPHGRGLATSSNNSLTPRNGSWVSLEERHLPALIVRCTQHILRWGVQEQGLFRVSGRSSHIAKLRAEFDTGADFNIMQSSPGDLDPHAVASIFKAYLRELPEPILTNDLMPFFDAAMVSERSSAKHVPDVLSSASVGMRKPPSLSTLATPNFTGVTPSESLRKALSSLIARLPQENRDLLLTVTEVIKLTAQRSHETKMPMSNLLLVLCPSLNMNPTLLQALCECEGIWDGWEASVGALAISSTDQLLAKGKIVDDGPSATPSDATNLAIEKQRFSRPLPRVPVDDTELPLAPADPATSHHSNYPMVSIPGSLIYAELPETSPSPVIDDGMSLRSGSERPTTPNSVNFKLINPYSPPSLSSSAESLSVPSLSSASPSQSAKNLQLTDDLTTPQSSTLAHSPIIAEPIPLPLTPSETASQSQFQFPSAGENFRKSPLIHKKSFSSSISGDIRAGSMGSRAKRLKKPSLHLLFSGRSSSPASTKSIHGNSTGTPPEVSLSSPSESSPAISMVTAPQSSRFSYPPVLNTAIDESSISLALGIQDEEVHAGLTSPKTSSTPQATDTEAKLLVTKKHFPQLDLPLSDGDDYGDTWTQSVLLAAGESRW
ncbi:hypothetical protein F5J12DRAFT_909841 [Pisolithus orientalis]|uniref:uncharacterized protein n=1 Tax=Pisolithus orientalis TaxID=936130 RepID=UPI00222420EB|nr:uncharacterized protein F5J12DRAFT_909841 [Pisolithus orientalis]KAI6033044.1 hypothetical protein F5J12DRAFT_909841 [Pisolithus orientalis]